MRNHFTTGARKKSRRSVTRKHRFTLFSTTLERVFHKFVLKSVLLFTNVSMVFSCSTIRVLAFGDMHQAKKMTFRSCLSLEIAEELDDAEAFLVMFA